MKTEKIRISAKKNKKKTTLCQIRRDWNAGAKFSNYVKLICIFSVILSCHILSSLFPCSVITLMCYTFL